MFLVMLTPYQWQKIKIKTEKEERETAREASKRRERGERRVRRGRRKHCVAQTEGVDGELKLPKPYEQ